MPRPADPVFNPFEEADMAMKRPDAGATPQAGPALLDEVFSTFYPTLFVHMTETVWEDGKKRIPSTLLLFVENGRWKAFLHDRDGKRGAWVTADSWEEVLQASERAIEASSTEWRKDTR
jgi:hypothetical protein